MKTLIVTSLVSACVTMTACSTNNVSEPEPDEKPKPINQVEKEAVEVEKQVAPPFSKATLPTTLKELVSFPPGVYESLQKDQVEEIEKAVADLPPITEAQAKDEDFVKAYASEITVRFQKHYPGPEVVVQKWKELAFGTQNVEDERYQFKENINVYLLIHTKKDVTEENVREELLKDIEPLVALLPKSVNVGLRIYSRINDMPETSCERQEVVYDVQPYNKELFEGTLHNPTITEQFSMKASIQAVYTDLQQFDEATHTNMLYVLNDDVHTCSTENELTNEDIQSLAIKPIVHVVEMAEGKELKPLANQLHGSYVVKDHQHLTKEFNRTHDIIQKWQEWQVGNEQIVNNEYSERSNYILDWRLEWHDMLQEQLLVTRKAFEVLEQQNKISLSTYLQMVNLNRDYISNLYQLRDHAINELFNLKDEPYEKVEEVIQETYHSER